MQPVPGEKENGKKERLILLVPDSLGAFPKSREDGDSGLEMRCGELESIGPAPLSDDVELCLFYENVGNKSASRVRELLQVNKQDLC